MEQHDPQSDAGGSGDESVVVLPVTDLNLPLPIALIWRKDNVSPLLAKFVADVRQLPEVKAFTNR
jgi:hypothetical protein